MPSHSSLQLPQIMLYFVSSTPRNKIVETRLSVCFFYIIIFIAHQQEHWNSISSTSNLKQANTVHTMSALVGSQSYCTCVYAGSFPIQLFDTQYREFGNLCDPFSPYYLGYPPPLTPYVFILSPSPSTMRVRTSASFPFLIFIKILYLKIIETLWHMWLFSIVYLFH